MKAVGIVAEYNPFHLGHEYHIAKTRELCPDKGIIAVMSGDFVQRGQAAVYDKHLRARAAVLGGADLVLELPLPWAVSSAEGFSRGAVGLLSFLGVVDAISFGSESGDTKLLAELADVLESPETNALIGEKLSRGIAYASARQAALEERLGDKAKAIAEPNNILGVEYIRAIKNLKADIKPLTVSRIGAGHDEYTEERIRSASQIRELIWAGEKWESFVPQQVYASLSGESPLDRRLMETAILSRLRWLGAEDISRVPDCAEGLHNRIFAAVHSCASLDEILEAVKTKRYAMARLRRMLLCAALGVEKGMNSGTPRYARVLAANETGLALLREMKGSSAIPVITKPAHGARLDGAAGECFELCAKARAFYALGCKNDPRPDSDRRMGPYLLK